MLGKIGAMIRWYDYLLVLILSPIQYVNFIIIVGGMQLSSVFNILFGFFSVYVLHQAWYGYCLIRYKMEYGIDYPEQDEDRDIF